MLSIHLNINDYNMISVLQIANFTSVDPELEGIASAL